jgi:hypothetical protein
MALTLLRNKPHQANVDDWAWEYYNKLVAGDIVPIIEYTGTMGEAHAKIFPGLIISTCLAGSFNKINILVRGQVIQETPIDWCTKFIV